jgi:Fe-S cluster assembly scaffold protein SufB
MKVDENIGHEATVSKIGEEQYFIDELRFIVEEAFPW